MFGYMVKEHHSKTCLFKHHITFLQTGSRIHIIAACYFNLICNYDRVYISAFCAFNIIFLR